MQDKVEVNIGDSEPFPKKNYVCLQTNSLVVLVLTKHRQNIKGKKISNIMGLKQLGSVII